MSLQKTARPGVAPIGAERTGSPRTVPPRTGLGPTIVRMTSIIAAGLCAVGSAHAGLGEAASSIDHDRQILRGASVEKESLPSYDRHEMQTADGTTVREFSARDGTVFAFDFAGPALPDLKVLLADHYDDYVAAAKARRGNHHVLSFASGGVVFTINRLQRGFRGAAHVPSLMPPGVGADDLR